MWKLIILLTAFSLTLGACSSPPTSPPPTATQLPPTPIPTATQLPPTSIPTSTRVPPTPIPTDTQPPPLQEIPVFEEASAELLADNSVLYTDPIGGYRVTLPAGWVTDNEDEPNEVMTPRLSATWYSPSSTISSDMHIFIANHPQAMTWKVEEVAQGFIDGITQDEVLVTQERIETDSGVEIYSIDTQKTVEPYRYQRAVFLKSKTAFLMISFNVSADDIDQAIPVIDSIVKSLEIIE